MKHISLKKKILTLVAGNATAQAILGLSSIVLARIYTPEQFGIFGVVVSVAMISSHVVTLRFENTFMLSKLQGQKNIVFIICAANFVLFTLLLLAIGTLLSGVQYKGVYIDSFFLIVSLLCTLVYTIYKLLTQYHLSSNQFAKISKSKVTQAAVLALTQICFYKLNGGLIYGYIIGFTVSILILYPTPSINFTTTKKRTYSFIKRNKNFILYETPGSLFSILSQSAILLALPYFFNFTVTGLFLLANRLISIPLSYLGNSIGQAYFTEITRNGVNISIVTKNLFLRLIVFTFPVFAILAIFAGDGAQLLMGEEWRDSGRYAEMLAPLFLMSFATSPLSYIFTALRAQKVDLKFMVFLFLMRISGLLLGGFSGSGDLTIILFSIFGSVALSIYGIKILTIAGNSKLIGVMYTTVSFCFIWLLFIITHFEFVVGLIFTY